MRLTLLLLTLTTTTQAQWQLQQSNTTASLRGIHAVTPQIAWASGTEGTILRTEDGGQTWLPCTTPPNAEKLDFRGIQAFDNKTAIAMSSGKGDQSRLYKTTDGCKTWTLVLTNPDKEGFWDSLQVESNGNGLVVGDPVNGEFKIFCKMDDDPKWSECWNEDIPKSQKDEGMFAASNTSMLHIPEDGITFMGTGGLQGARILRACVPCTKQTSAWSASPMPMFPGRDSAGVFSIAAAWGKTVHLVAVGGDYKLPNQGTQNVAFSLDYGLHWQASTTTPHGYRSAVVYDPTTKSWLTVGPNGTDISTDDGRNWHPLNPPPGEASDTAQHWNALSLPFVVGPKGRIGKLEPTALKP